jgi:cytosolic carboxypeptidase protein 2/3
LLTITDSSIGNEEKICLVSIGRIHPGESNGSYVVEGFLKYVLSEDAREMRKHVVFKVIPMVNPDGVIFGNYRTSLSGKDLNRMFRAKNVELIPEVYELKSFIKKLKYEHKFKVTYFLDFHGHSLKKNVFFYGPEYDIWSVKYDKAKILPKILSTRTEMFRMKSCLFKVASVKKSTARAFMLAYIPYCYTVESSLGIYKDSKNLDHPFTIKKWKEVGYKIGESFT